jgi:TPR repeat protein
VVLSAEWLPGDEMESLRFIFGKIRAVLNHKEFINISKVVLLDVNEPFVKELQAFLEKHHNPKAFSNTEINHVEIREGLMIVSPISSIDEILPNSSDILTKASQWIRKAATQGDSEAQTTLGLMYLKGEGVKLAKKWFKKAAALGNVQAQSHLETLCH